jgi:hypothetical protein
MPSHIPINASYAILAPFRLSKPAFSILINAFDFFMMIVGFEALVLPGLLPEPL